MAQVTTPGGTPTTSTLPVRRPAAPPPERRPSAPPEPYGAAPPPAPLPAAPPEPYRDVPLPAAPPEPPRDAARPVRCILAVEIADFGRADRDDELREMLRQVLYRLLGRAFDDAGIGWRACAAVDRGDAFLVIAPPAVPAAALAGPLLGLLRAGLALYNRYASVAARLRLRAGLHTGPVGDDAAGAAVWHTLHLAGCRPVRAALRDDATDLALVASDRLFADVIRHGDGAVDPAAYRPIPLGDGEPGERTRGWVALPAPGHPPATPRPHGDRPDAGAWPGADAGHEGGPEPATGGHPGVTVRLGEVPQGGGAAGFGFFGNVTFGGDAVAGDKIVYM